MAMQGEVAGEETGERRKKFLLCCKITDHNYYAYTHYHQYIKQQTLETSHPEILTT